MVRVSPRVLCGHCRGPKSLTGRFGRRRPRTGIPEVLDRHWTVTATDVTGCARPDQLRPPCKARSCRPISSSSHFFVKPWTGIGERRRLYTQTGLADSFFQKKRWSTECARYNFDLQFQLSHLNMLAKAKEVYWQQPEVVFTSPITTDFCTVHLNVSATNFLS